MPSAYAPGRTPRFDVVVAVASLGGIAAYRQVLSALPADFPVPVVLVQHRPADDDRLAALLARYTDLPVRRIAEGVLPGRPGVHVVDPPVTGTPGWQGDRVLTAMTQACGSRTCAVVLTGRLDDGARGVGVVKQRGGFVVVQDPATATAAGMPTAAIATGCVDLVVPLRVVGPAVLALALAPGAAEMYAAPPRPWARLVDA